MRCGFLIFTDEAGMPQPGCPRFLGKEGGCGIVLKSQGLVAGDEYTAAEIEVFDETRQPLMMPFDRGSHCAI
jgi:hypothetical protein